MSISREAIKSSVDVHRIVDRLVDSGSPLDSHPIQVSGEEIAYLDESLCHLTMRWLQRRGVVITE